MDNIDDYYLNPNIDGSIQDFFDRVLGTAGIIKPVKLNVNQLTSLAILDCIDAAIDNNDKKIFLFLSKLVAAFSAAPSKAAFPGTLPLFKE